MDASRDQKYIKTIVAGVCRAAEENNIGICIESLPEDTTTICNEADTFPGNSIRICDNLASLSFFNNATCYVCNGYYGPHFDDPLCSICHAFLYPNAATQVEVPSMFDNASDSDSGNEEPDDGHDCSGDKAGLFEMPVRMRSMAQVGVDSLEYEIHRLSVYAPRPDQVNIELLPTEVLMHMFTYLDEISLWAIGQVCSRWREILFMFVKPERWHDFVAMRWPLLGVNRGVECFFREQDWYELYNTLMWSSCCLKCVKQMAYQERSQEEENHWRRHRLRTELRTMRNDPLDGIDAKPLDTFCGHWQATIEGPAGSPYEGGLFFLYIQVPSTYPLHPPNIRFITKIFHPNVSRHGDIGIDSIHHNWSLALTISKLLISIQSLLTDPYCDVCMEPDIGDMYIKNRTMFEEYARLWTIKYAMHDIYAHWKFP